MKETKQQKKERLQGIKKGSKEYNELTGNEKKSWNAYDRRKFVEGNKFISKEKRANIELWNEKISKNLGLEEIQPNVDLAFQKMAMPDTFKAIEDMQTEREAGIQIQDEGFTHLNDFWAEVAAYESLGNVFKWGEFEGDEAKEKVMEEFSSEGGKVWVNYNVDNGEIKITAFGMYQVAPEDEENEEDEEKEEKPSGYFKKMELINGQMVETSENPNKKE